MSEYSNTNEYGTDPIRLLKGLEAIRAVKIQPRGEKAIVRFIEQIFLPNEIFMFGKEESYFENREITSIVFVWETEPVQEAHLFYECSSENFPKISLLVELCHSARPPPNLVVI